MEEIHKLLDEVSNIEEHYLVKSRKEGNNYFNEFSQAATILKPIMTDKEYQYWCAEKMLLKQQPFAEKTFIQYAVETSVVRFFGERFPKNFQIEAKINPTNQKDVDCRFMDGEFTFNVEVKCSDFISKEKIDNKEGFKFDTIGRLTDRGQEAFDIISSALDEGLQKKGEPLKPHLKAKNMDNNLMEFLVLAHEKFDPTPKENEVNILVVGCDDALDMQKWINYMWSGQGLFTEESFADKSTYQRVDLVVLTNQYFKHNKYFQKQVSGSWSLHKCFNLVFVNPYRKISKTDGIKHFLSIFPNMTEEVGEYEVPGTVPEYIKDAVRINWFVKDHLEKQQGIYLFEDKR